ncbi:MAG: diguanylate cyclase [Butyrivibrio sp.]|nr:diguanylate cyclase [Butyrivibrio sp.]
MGYWIVVVDDEPLSLKNAKMLLSGEDMKVSCLRSGSELLKFLEKNDPDLILLDVMMPEMDGFETISAVHEYEEKIRRSWTPVIFLTGENDSEAERRGLKVGASDFIHKPFDRDALINRITNTIENSRKIENLTEEATLDKLTGFFNKANGTSRISGICGSTEGVLMLFDLDNFKLVNDLYGHDMGDKVLVALSTVIRHNVRADDIVSRIGGDEFMAYFPHMSEKSAVASLSERINTQLMNEACQLMGDDHGIPLGVSVGAAFSPQHSPEYKILFQFADSALYKAKLNGRHGYFIYDAASDAEHDAEDLELEIGRVSQIMEERGDRKGALILGKEAFSWNYKFITRYIDRYGTVATRLLFSLRQKGGGMPSPDTIDEFSGILKRNLRKSDIIFQNRPNQFFVVLPTLTSEDSPKVIDRIKRAWSINPEHESTNISFAMALIKKENH